MKTGSDDRRRLTLLAGAVAVIVILGLLFLDSGTASREEKPHRTHEFTVRVVGADGGPLSLVLLNVNCIGHRSAGPDGWVRFLLPEPLESVLLQVVYPPQPESETVFEVRNGGELVLSRARNLEVVAIDAETGERLPGCRLSIFRGTEAKVGIDLDDPGQGTLRPGPVLAGSSDDFSLKLECPAGHTVGSPPWLRFNESASRLADRYRLKIPVWPELPVTVHIREQDGRAVEGAVVTRAMVAARGTATKPLPSGQLGNIEVRGLRAIPGEEVRISVEKDGRIASGAVAIEGFHLPVVVEVTLPPPGFAGASSSTSIGIGGGAGGAFGGRGGERGTPPDASLAVRVLRRGGRPAANTMVVLRRHKQAARTDAAGIARFERLRPMEEWVTVEEPGYVPGPPVRVVLRSGAEVGVTIHEGVGRTSFIRVLDADHRPVCSAEVSVRTANEIAYTPVVDGVQDLVILTDRDGRAVLPDLPEGKVTVRARYGSRKVKGEMNAGEPLDLVLER